MLSRLGRGSLFFQELTVVQSGLETTWSFSLNYPLQKENFWQEGLWCNYSALVYIPDHHKQQDEILKQKIEKVICSLLPTTASILCGWHHLLFCLISYYFLPKTQLNKSIPRAGMLLLGFTHYALSVTWNSYYLLLGLTNSYLSMEPLRSLHIQEASTSGVRAGWHPRNS